MPRQVARLQGGGLDDRRSFNRARAVRGGSRQNRRGAAGRGKEISGPRPRDDCRGADLARADPCFCDDGFCVVKSDFNDLDIIADDFIVNFVTFHFFAFQFLFT